MDPWSPYKELLLTIQEVIGLKQYESTNHLQALLRQQKSRFTNLLSNPVKRSQDREAVKKSVSEGILLEGDNHQHNFQQDFIDEALILSDLFDLNEYSALGLLLVGEQQLSNYPALTRGLVAVLLYWDGRRCLVNSLKTLIQSRAGHSWTLDVSDEVVGIVTKFTDELLDNGIVETILKLLQQIKVEDVINKLSEQRGLGNAKHRRQIRDIIEEIRVSLAECLFNFSAQSNLSQESLTSILRYLESSAETSASGTLDNTTLTLAFAAVYGFALPTEIPLEPDDKGVDVLLQHPLLKSNTYVKSIQRILTNNKQWKVPGIKAFVQLAWSLSLHGLAQVPNVISDLLTNNIYNDSGFADCIEADEKIIELALEQKVFLFIRECMLSSELCKEEMLIRKIHDIITDLIHSMPIKIKEMRSNGDEIARIGMLQQEANDTRKDFLHLMELITEMYKTDKYELGLSSDYWCVANYNSAFLNPRSNQRLPRKSDLNKFVRQSADLLPPLLYVPYINMLAALAKNKSNASNVFDMLRNNSNGEGNLLSWNHFFGSFNKYYSTLRQEKQPSLYENPMQSFNASYQSTRTSTYTITPQEVDGLKAVLNLVSSVAEFDAHACLAIYENPQWNIGVTLVGMLQCPIPTELKSSIIQTLEKFARIPEISIGVMVMLENCQILGATADTGNRSLIAELDEVESKQETYQMTQSFLKLVSVLSDSELSMNLPANSNSLQFDPYINFACENVFLKFLSRAYKQPAEKWQIASSCLQLFTKMLKQYSPDPSNFVDKFVEPESIANSMSFSAFGTVKPALMAPKPPGFNLLIRIMSDENMFKNILSVVDNCVKYLDSFVHNSDIEADIIKAGSFALDLILTVLNLQDEFLACMRNSGSSIFLNTMDRMLLSVNTVTRKADYIVSIAKFVPHSVLNPKLSMSAVEILFWIAKSSTASQHKVVDMLANGCSRRVRDVILHGFVEALESTDPELDDEHAADYSEIEYLHSKCRLTILRLLLFCVNLPQPNLAHFLMGFNLTKSANQTSLQDPGVLGSQRTCLHSILMILSGLDYSSSVNSLNSKVPQNTPVLTELSFQLIYRLAANMDTSGPLLRYLRSSHDFIFRHIGNLPFELPESTKRNTIMLQQAWLLKTTAIELFLTTSNRQRSHTQRLIKLLFTKISNGLNDQNDTTDASLLNPNATSLLNLSTKVFHNTTVNTTAAINTTLNGTIQHLEKCRILQIINMVDFQEEMPEPLQVEQFVTSYIEELITSCEVTNHFGVVYCDIKMLHNLLQSSINSLRGPDDMGRKPLAAQEVEEILKVAVERNQTRESMHSKLTLITAWRHVIEIAFSSCPNDLLSKEERQNIIFDILQEVLKHALNPNATPELITPLAPLFLTLITHLQAILIGPHGLLKSSYEKSVVADITQMQEFNLDVILNPEENETITPNMVGPLQAIIKSMIEWLLQSTMNSKVRTHLYAALLYYMHLCHKPKKLRSKDGLDHKGRRHGLRILSQNIYSKLARENIKLFQSFGDSLMELLCRDSCDGHNVCRILAYACLDAIVKIDWEQTWLQYMLKKGYISHIAHSITEQDVAIQQSLTPQLEPLSSLYIYEQKLALLCSIALTGQGAKEVIESGVFGKLAEAQFFDLRPTFDDGNNMSSFLPGMMSRYRQVLQPALKLCINVLSTLGMRHHYEANALILEFFLSHCDALITSVLRQHSLMGDVESLNELQQITSVLSQVASQNFSDQAIYASVPQNVVIELQGHITKIQRHLMSLLPEYCMDVETLKTMKKRMEFETEDSGENFHDVALLVHEIQSDLLTYCRNMLNFGKSSDLENSMLMFTLNMNAKLDVKTYTNSSMQSPGVGLLIQILKESVEKYNYIEKDSAQLKRKLDNISNLPIQDLKKVIEGDEKLTMSQRRALCAIKFQSEIESNSQILRALFYNTEIALMILWHHLDVYILKMLPQDQTERFFNLRNKGNETSLNKSSFRKLQDFSSTFAHGQNQNIPHRDSSSNASKEELIELKQILPTVLTDIFLEKILNLENVKEKGVHSSFIQPIVRRIQRIVKLHT